MSKEKSALVVIDMQNWEINDSTKNLPKKIAEFIDKNRERVDYLIFTQSFNSKNFNLYKLLGVKRGISGYDTYMVKGLERLTNKNNLFRKYTYSAFKSKKFVNFLKKNRISKLYLCGINTDICVLATYYDAFDLGYNVRVLGNLCGSVINKENHDGAIRIMKKLVVNRIE